MPLVFLIQRAYRVKALSILNKRQSVFIQMVFIILIVFLYNTTIKVSNCPAVVLSSSALLADVLHPFGEKYRNRAKCVITSSKGLGLLNHVNSALNHSIVESCTSLLAGS
jgi:hypothetical protein